MLSIGKLAKGQADYYLSAVAQGAEDYYLGAGEAPGRWCGNGSTDLSLSGEVAADDLRDVLTGIDPVSHRRLARGNRTLPGFDCTFSAPKSVSIVHALGGDVERAAISEAHDAAVDAALGYLERQAAFGRRGRNGVHRVESSGFVAAAFRHRTSRASDPHLHTHVLVANMVKGADGRWGALDGRLVFAHKMDAGAVYQSHLRAELTDRLGLRWHTPQNGLAELADVPTAVVKEFSRRRAEIEALLEARGESSAAASATATLATRRSKVDVDGVTLLADWRQRADALGFATERISELVRVPKHERPSLRRDQVPDELTRQTSYFDRRNAVRLIATSSRTGLRVDELERRADACLSDEQIVELTPDALTGARFTTKSMLRAEESLLTVVERGTNERVAVANAEVVAAATAARPSLSVEQRNMVETVTQSGARVDVVVGAAGAGKTYALDAAREAWTASGHRVIGCALAARAAAQLEGDAGIPSFTISALQTFLRDDRLPAHSVLVVDEAGMVGTRVLDDLVRKAVRSDAKVVLVGDHRQLPEIEAGGAFGHLARQPGALHLEDNRRQRDSHERVALRDWRRGAIREAIDRLRRRGNVVQGDNSDVLRTRLVVDWKEAIDNGEIALMLARRRADVADLNQRARRELQATGYIDPATETTVAGLHLCEGDWVLARRNNRRVGVHNGDLGVVAAVNENSVTVQLDRGPIVEVPNEYIADGHLDYGYAITVHKAQGATCDRTFVLGDESLHKELGYTAMSRGRLRNQLYVMAPESEREKPGGHGVGTEGSFDLVAAIQRSEAQLLARSLLRDRTPGIEL